MKRLLLYVLSGFLFATPVFASTGDIYNHPIYLDTADQTQYAYPTFTASTTGTIGTITAAFHSVFSVGDVYFRLVDENNQNICANALNSDDYDSATGYTDDYRLNDGSGATSQDYDISSYNCHVEAGHDYTLSYIGWIDGSLYDGLSVSPDDSQPYLVISTDSAASTIPNVAELRDISVSGISSTSATLQWASRQNGSIVISYGETSSYGPSESLGTSSSSHGSFTLMGLSPHTTYHYKIEVTNANGTGTSGDMTFRTTNGYPTPATTTGDIYTNLADLSATTPGGNLSFEPLENGTISTIETALNNPYNLPAYFDIVDTDNGNTPICSSGTTQLWSFISDLFTSAFTVTDGTGQTAQVFDLSPYGCSVTTGHHYAIYIGDGTDGNATITAMQDIGGGTQLIISAL